ncbi:hypothetical protein LCGC14_1525320 [marine sediment metagenome]|uniref:Helicase C-terminal domain-containing protein n=1 Tax=marine sediment metagenome TaxID=412755 RepID=A0A0F9IXB2_9ZZZZ
MRPGMGLFQIGNRYLRLTGIDPATIKEIDRVTSYRVAGFMHDPRWKRKPRRWDGKEHLLEFRPHDSSYRAPVGLYEDVVECLGTNHTITVERGRPKPPDLGMVWTGPKLRPYQQEAVDAFVCPSGPGGEERHGRGIISLPIRSGKTLTAAAVVARLGTTAIFLVPSQLLLAQARDTLTEALSVDVGVIGAGVWDPKQITVATVQSLARKRGKRITSSAPEYLDLVQQFGLAVFDECFPAGTLVDRRPIETLSPGDTVTAFDEKTGSFHLRRVARVFKSKPKVMVTVHTTAGAVSCTSNHPFWTRRGWVNAEVLQTSDMVLYTTHGQKDTPDGVPYMRQSSDLRGMARLPKKVSGILLDGVQPSLPEPTLIGDNDGDESQIRLGADEGEQPDEAPRGTGQGEHKGANQGVGSQGATRRQRAWTDSSTNAPGEYARLGNGACGSNGEKPGRGTADGLQGGHREPGTDDRDRGKRGIPRQPESSSSRQAQDRSACWARVDRVELHEQGSDGKFGGLCADGHVYNIEVEGLHTYVAGGFVVHNCHHLTGTRWHRVMSDFEARYRLGLSATAFLDDDHEIERGVIWLKASTGPIRYDVGMSQMIDEGYLLAPNVTLHKIHEPDLRRRDWSRHLKDAGVYLNPGRNQLITDLAVEHTRAGRKTLVVSKSLAQVESLRTSIKESGVACEAMIGTTPAPERRDLIARFVAGRLPVIVGTVFGEGVDIPECDVVINADGGRDRKATVQRMRCLTPCAGKSEAFVDDFLDLMNPYLADHSRERLKVYRSEPAFKIRVVDH